jgi:hypothetical protein
MFSSMLDKTKFISILLITFSLIACKNGNVKTKTSSDIFNSYCINHKASLFKVPPGIVSIFLDESQKGNTELKDLLADVDELSFLIISKTGDDKGECRYLNELNSSLDSINFKDLAQINNGKEIIRVKVDRARKHFEELLVLVSNNDAVYCISFKGRIHPKKVVNLVKPENVIAVTNLNRFKR